MTLTKTDFFQYALIFLVVLWPAWVLVFALTRELLAKILSLVRSRKGARPATPILVSSIPAEKPLPLS